MQLRLSASHIEVFAFKSWLLSQLKLCANAHPGRQQWMAATHMDNPDRFPHSISAWPNPVHHQKPPTLNFIFPCTFCIYTLYIILILEINPTANFCSWKTLFPTFYNQGLSFQPAASATVNWENIQIMITGGLQTQFSNLKKSSASYWFYFKVLFSVYKNVLI